MYNNPKPSNMENLAKHDVAWATAFNIMESYPEIRKKIREVVSNGIISNMDSINGDISIQKAVTDSYKIVEKIIPSHVKNEIIATLNIDDKKKEEQLS